MLDNLNTQEAITLFDGVHSFLSNSYKLRYPISFGETLFPTVEHAVQASKTKDLMARQRIARASNADIARRISSMSMLRSDWEAVKMPLMKEFVRQKFNRNGELIQMLADTGSAALIYGNTRNDTYWGMVWDAQQNTWTGENWLGRILMTARDLVVKAIHNDCEEGCDD